MKPRGFGPSSKVIELDRIFYGTKIVRAIKHSVAFHFEKWWGFQKGEMVNLRVRKQDGTGNDIRAVKKVCEIGNSYTIFLNREFGFEEGDVIIIEMSKLSCNTPMGETYEPDAGSKAEKADQGLSEL